MLGEELYQGNDWFESGSLDLHNWSKYVVIVLLAMCMQTQDNIATLHWSVELKEMPIGGAVRVCILQV